MFISSAAPRGHGGYAKSQRTKEQLEMPVVDEQDRETIPFHGHFEGRSALDDLARQGAERVLQMALEEEVDEFLQRHGDRRDDKGNRQVVRNGRKLARDILTGAGPLEVQQPRVRDKSANKEERVQFTSSILPPYLRRSKSVEELIPVLYLQGVSTGNFQEALEALLGEHAKGLSANVIVRLKNKWVQEYEDWSRRDLSETQYIYFWADGIHTNVRLEDRENKDQCLLVLIGVTADGHKELIAVQDGYRESKQSWYELLIDLKQRGYVAQQN